MVEMWGGVNTGALFGSYLYGSGLGPRIAGTPPFIGLSWVLMIYLTSAIFTPPMQCNLLDGIVWPSLMMVGYDLVMEHVAPKMDMWSWQEDVIPPIQNYLMWGAAGCHLPYNTLHDEGQRPQPDGIAALHSADAFLSVYTVN